MLQLDLNGIRGWRIALTAWETPFNSLILSRTFACVGELWKSFFDVPPFSEE